MAYNLKNYFERMNHLSTQKYCGTSQEGNFKPHSNHLISYCIRAFLLLLQLNLFQSKEFRTSLKGRLVLYTEHADESLTDDQIMAALKDIRTSQHFLQTKTSSFTHSIGCKLKYSSESPFVNASFEL